MCYSGMYIKENATIDDFKKIIDDHYNSLLWSRNEEEEMRLLNEKYRKEYEEYLKSNENHGTSGHSGCSVAGSSINSKSYIGHMAAQVYSVRSYYPNIKFPKNWISMWKEKFKNEPEVLLEFQCRIEILPKIERLRLERMEKLATLQSIINE